jgi:hypothetical protein
MDAAIQGFLYRVFNHIQIGKMGYVLQWVLEKGILLIPEESSMLLFKIKMVYKMNSYEELKELIGLGDFVLK